MVGGFMGTGNTTLEQWYNEIKERGHCKALAAEGDVIPASRSKYTDKHGVRQIPIVSKNLVDKFAKKIENNTTKRDTLETLFNIF